jgi:vacuolar-type H+-ATPase subunit I/STV1
MANDVLKPTRSSRCRTPSRPSVKRPLPASASWKRCSKAEHSAFVARIRELEASLDGERRAQADQIVELQKTFAAEREAAIARIRELEASLDGERRAQANQIVEMQKEREAAIARIHELEAILKAEHDSFVARIRELEHKGLKPALRRVLTRILQAANK